MKVLLIFPPNVYFKRASEVHVVEPLGIAYIAAVLEQAGYDVRLIDADAENIEIPHVLQRMRDYRPDVVGFSILTPLADIALEICRKAKKELDFVSVFGNVHATTYPEMARLDGVDYVCHGEGEYAMLELVRAIEGGKDPHGVPGFYYADADGNLVNTGVRARLQLDEIPFPARHLLPMQRYSYEFPIYSDRRRVYASANFSRGCVYKCTFCSSPSQWESKVTYRSAENIVAELKELKDNFGVNTFYIRDEVFTINKKNVVSICQKMIEERLDMHWFCYGRADHIDEATLTYMRDAGCMMVKIGVETGDPEIMKLIKKGETLDQLERAFRLCDKLGLYTHASFMIGHPWDSRDSVQRTIDFAKKLNADTTVFPISTPFPGTELWDIVKRENLLLTEDFSQYGYIESPVAKTLHLDAHQIVSLQKKALRQYYLRPGYMKKVVKRVWRDPRSLVMYAAPFKTLLKWMT
ncbi:MAG: radical SAM protein [Acidobacteriota bacterium]